MPLDKIKKLIDLIILSSSFHFLNDKFYPIAASRDYSFRTIAFINLWIIFDRFLRYPQHVLTCFAHNHYLWIFLRNNLITLWINFKIRCIPCVYLILYFCFHLLISYPLIYVIHKVWITCGQVVHLR